MRFYEVGSLNVIVANNKNEALSIFFEINPEIYQCFKQDPENILIEVEELPDTKLTWIKSRFIPKEVRKNYKSVFKGKDKCSLVTLNDLISFLNITKPMGLVSAINIIPDWMLNMTKEEAMEFKHDGIRKAILDVLNCV